MYWIFFYFVTLSWAELLHSNEVQKQVFLLDKPLQNNANILVTTLLVRCIFLISFAFLVSIEYLVLSAAALQDILVNDHG